MSDANPKDTPTQDRRAKTRELVKKLVAQRSEVLVLFWRVAGVGSGPAVDTRRALMPEFCQMLVDYIAAGHFTVYERILSGQERRKRVADVAAELYPALAETTEAVLAFNERYQGPQAVRDRERLSEDLSQLGEVLANRIDLEDKLLSQLL